MGKLILVVALALAGCAPLPTVYRRIDGQPPDQQQFEAAKLICRGETQKAAAQGGSSSTINSPIGPDRQDSQIYAGCMAQHGYMATAATGAPQP